MLEQNQANIFLYALPVIIIIGFFAVHEARKRWGPRNDNQQRPNFERRDRREQLIRQRGVNVTGGKTWR